MKDLIILKATISFLIFLICLMVTPEIKGKSLERNIIRLLVYLVGIYAISLLWFPALGGYVYTNYYH